MRKSTLSQAISAYTPRATDLIDIVTALRRLKLLRGAIVKRRARIEAELGPSDGPSFSAIVDSYTTAFIQRMIPKLRAFLEEYRAGTWLLSQGVTPFVAAYYLRLFDVRKARNPSSFWAYAGLAPGRTKYHRGAADACMWHYVLVLKSRSGPRWMRELANNWYRRALSADSRCRFAKRANILKEKALAVGAPYPTEWDTGRLGRAYLAEYVRRQVTRVFLGRLYSFLYFDYYGRRKSVYPLRVLGSTVSLSCKMRKLYYNKRPLSELYDALDQVRRALRPSGATT